MCSVDSYTTSQDALLERGCITMKLADGTEAYNTLVYNKRNLPTFANKFLERMEDMVQNFKCRPDDVLIYGYMKSGTHWLWEIIRMLQESTSVVATDVGKARSFIECQTWQAFEELPSPRILSTHLMYDDLPADLVNVKTVVPIRNPKDVAVSLYHHLTEEKNGTNLRCGWERFTDEVFFSPQYAIYYPWTEYTADTWDRCQKTENMLPIIYEQLLENPVDIIRDLSHFLGLSTSETMIEQIAQATRFDKMKEKKKPSEKIFANVFSDGYTMFRKGTKGDWKNHFTEEQAARFDQKIAEACEQSESLKHLMMIYK